MSVTLAELIEARDGLAVIMSYCDDEEAALYVPIFERLEREVEAAQGKQDALGAVDKGRQPQSDRGKCHEASE